MIDKYVTAEDLEYLVKDRLILETRKIKTYNILNRELTRNVEAKILIFLDSVDSVVNGMPEYFDEVCV